MNNRLLAGRYELIEKSGEGGMAIVYKGKDRLLNRYVAIKILRPEFTKDEKFIENFIRESQAAAGLTHPNIVGVYDVGQEGNIHYIVMELIQGKPLSDIIAEKGRLNYKEAINFTIQIAEALSLAHKNQIVHRDVKPHNVLVTNQGVAKLADFGIAMPLSQSEMTNSSDKVMGSVHYFSPEQARGAYVDERSDIYSLGVVLYEMLTGHVPFDGDNPVSVALQHINDPFPSAKDEVREVPYQLDRIIKKATEKYQSKRYKNVDEMIEDLKSISYIESRFGKNALYENFGSDDQEERSADDSRHSDHKKSKDRSSDRKSSSGSDKKNSGKSKSSGNKKEGKGFFQTEKGSKIIIIGGIAIVAIVAVLLIGTLAGWFSPEEEEVAVPKFIGCTFDEAESKAEEAGLVIERGDDVYSNDQEEGYVTAQSPSEGSMVKPGKVITINISKGKREGVMPKLVGLTLEEAEASIDENGLKRGTVIKITSTEPEGQVVTQSVEAGQPVEQDTVINLEISDGQGVEQTIVPDLYGRTPDEAKNLLTNLKLKVGEVTFEERADIPQNTIFWQSISADTEVDIKTKVSYKVSKGEPPEDSGNGTDGEETEDEGTDPGEEGTDTVDEGDDSGDTGDDSGDDSGEIDDGSGEDDGPQPAEPLDDNSEGN